MLTVAVVIALTVLALAGFALVVAIHYHGHALIARIEAALSSTEARLMLHHAVTASPAPAPVTHSVVVNYPVAPASGASPALLPPPPTTSAVVETAPRIPTPQIPADWPAGSGFLSDTLVPNTLLPGSPIGEGAWSYAYAQLRYPALAPSEIAAMVADPEFTARGFVWRADGVPCAGPYKA